MSLDSDLAAEAEQTSQAASQAAPAPAPAPAQGNGDSELDEDRIVERIAERLARQQLQAPAPQVIFTQPAPRATRERVAKKDESTTSKSQQTLIQRLFPTATEKIEVRKNRDVGEPSFCGAYSMREVANASSIEEFLLRTVAPRFRYGAYNVRVVGPGQPQEFTVHLEEPIDEQREALRAQQSPTQQALDLLRTTIERRGSTIDPDVAVELEQMRRQLVGSSGDSALIARLDAIERTIRNQPQGEDPVSKKLIEIFERQSATSLPAMPMPTPGPTATEIAEAVRGAVRETVDAIMARQPQQAPQKDPFDQLDKMTLMMERLRPPPPPPQGTDPKLERALEQIESLRKENEDQRRTAMEDQITQTRAQVAELKQILTTPSEPEGPLEQVEKMASLMEAIEKLGARRARPGGGVQSAGEFLRDIVKDTPDIMREAGKLIDKARDRDVAAKARTEAARDALRERTSRKANGGASRPASQTAPQQEPAEPKRPYPKGFEPHAEAIRSASSDGDRVRALFKAFEFLGRSDPWKPYFQQTMTLLRKRDRSALQFTDALLQNFKRSGVVTDTLRETINRALASKFDEIATALFG
jgi:hypothetical protein